MGPCRSNPLGRSGGLGSGAFPGPSGYVAGVHTIAENLRAVRLGIEDACRAAGRRADAVTLIAVSKTKPAAALLEARAAGQQHFGENYAQELRDKADDPALAGIVWHFIGALQTNKAKLVAPRATLVHDVDRMDLAFELGRRAGVTHAGQRTVGVLIGVNIGAEPQKSGVLPENTLALATEFAIVPGISLRGLMCIPPAEGDPRPHFERLRNLRDEGLARGLPLHELSMGMSEDYADAIACGATFVRIGSAIFGARAPRAG